jgi:cytochrome c556
MRGTIPALLVGVMLSAAAAADERVPVDLPPMMREHMLANMREHLEVLAQAQGLAAKESWDPAAQLVENRLGMSSLESHGASHMAQHMPPAMGELGSEMHRAASRLSRVLQEADPMRVLAGFAEVLERCQACHRAFRIH